MKFAITIAVLSCWTTVTTASDIHPEFPHHLYDSVLRCQDDSSINFSNAVITQIGRDFISSHLITYLDLRNNSIRIITDGAFDKLPKLTNLYLSDNPLDDISLFAFGGHQALKVLALDTMRIDRNYYDRERYIVPIHGKYPNLEILSIHGNAINDLVCSEEISSCKQTTVFPKLKFLDLSNNRMGGTSFVKLLPESLTHLRLQDNSLRNLLSFNTKNLTTLTLDNNLLYYVGKYSGSSTSGLSLARLENLRYLSLSNNKISSLQSFAFQDTINLVHLNLSANYINYLYPECFANVQLLETLDLSRNNLRTVPEISRETNIITLFLNRNNITYINDQTFARTPKLKVLYLGRNQIDHINANAFSPLHHLEKLDLTNNELTSLPKGWCDDLESLEYLNLNDNRFTSLESLSLMNTLPLMEVYLAMNPLAYLDAGSFNDLPRNVTVNLVGGPPESLTQCFE